MMNKLMCAPSKDSDQHGHLPNQTRNLTVHSMDSFAGRVHCFVVFSQTGTHGPCREKTCLWARQTG